MQPNALPIICKPHIGAFLVSLCRSAYVIDRPHCTQLDCKLEAYSLCKRYLNASCCKQLIAYIQIIVLASSMRYQYSSQPWEIIQQRNQGKGMKARAGRIRGQEARSSVIHAMLPLTPMQCMPDSR